jgi:hypothetical protein
MKRVSTADKAKAAERHTAAVMNDPKSTPAQRLAAAEAEQRAGAGTWSREHDLEAG